MSYIGKAPGVGVRNRYYFTATGGETSLSGTDDASNTLAFSDGKYVDVTLNGVTLVAGTDYDTATANTIDNLTALTAGDVVEIVVYDVFSIAAAVPPTGGTFTGLVQFDDQIIIPRGTTAQRPASPVAGSIRFNTTESRYEGYMGTGWAFLSDVPSVAVQYLVIAGGGAGGGATGGGGGAGGYRSSVSGEPSGGNSTAETPLSVALGSAVTLTVGSGGAGVANANGNNGSNSIFGSITSLGGGGGGQNATVIAGNSGGSGGGSTNNFAGGSGTSGQGSDGGANTNWSGYYPAGGGGGAGAAGQSVGGSVSGGNGGDGIQSSITGAATYRAGGGGGGVYQIGVGGTGGQGGGGNGTQSGTPTAGAANTGGGGGGEGANDAANPGGAGGSGVIILKVPAGFSASFSAGVSQTSTTVGTDTVYTITAAGASDTVTFS